MDYMMWLTWPLITKMTTCINLIDYNNPFDNTLQLIRKPKVKSISLCNQRLQTFHIVVNYQVNRYLQRIWKPNVKSTAFWNQQPNLMFQTINLISIFLCIWHGSWQPKRLLFAIDMPIDMPIDCQIACFVQPTW